MADKFCVHCMAPLQSEEKNCGCCKQEMDYEAPAHHLPAETVLKKRYLLGKAIGEGGFGITYIGRDQVLNLRVAIKEYYPNGYSNRNSAVSNWVTLSKAEDQEDWFSQGRERFLQEAQTLAQFYEEPGVVGVRDFFEENGTAYIVMDYLDGVTMKDLIRQKGPVPPEKLLPLLEPVMIALEKIHDKGLIHRDISPDNLMLLKNGTVKLLDFGAVRNVTADKSLSVVLKPGYAPEEQYRTKGQQGPWTDVYALCATIYKCITGITPDESLERAYEDRLKAPSALGIAMQPKQEQILLQGLRIRRSERIQNMYALRKGLMTAEAEETTHSLHIQRQAEEVKTVYQPSADTVQTVYQTEEKTVPQEKKEDPAGKTETAAAEGKKQTAPAPEKKPRKPEKKKTPGKKRLLPVICGAVAALAVMLVLLAPESPEEKITTVPGTDSYSLTLVGQMEDRDRSIRITDQSLRDSIEGSDAFRMLNYLGETVSDQATEAKYLGYGLYAVTSNPETAVGLCPEVNRVSLVDSQGNVRISQGACWISRPYQMEDADTRYLLVGYATAQTEKEAECVFCLSRYGDVYTTPLDDGVMYDGYIRIYDLEENRFLENLPEIKAFGDVRPCGSSLVIGSYPDEAMYDAEGNVLVEGNVSGIGDGTLITADGSTYRVYDEKGVQTYYANQHLGIVEDSPYITMDAGDKKIVMDRNGNVVLPAAYSQIYGEHDGIFEVGNAGKYGLVTAEGKEIVPCQYQWISKTEGDYFAEKYFSCRRGDAFTLVGRNGIIAAKLSSGTAELAVVQDDRALVLNNRSFDLNLAGRRHSTLTQAMMAVSSEVNGLYGVYDLYTGTQLLACEYETVAYAAGYLYAYKNAVWEIYRISHSK